MMVPSGKSPASTRSATLAISVILPVRDESPSLEELHGELATVLDAMARTYEILFVNDGSTDTSLEVMHGIASVDPRVRILSFNRPRGKSAVYMAGFAAARGNVIITLDSDLQDDPAEIPRLVAALGEDTDIAIGWKQGRLRNEPEKTLPSRVFNRMVSIVFGVRLHDINCGFRAMSRDVARSLHLYGDYYRFLPLIAHTAGFRVVELAISHRRRKHGESKYGPRRFWTGVLDLLALRFTLSFREKPLPLFGSFALAFLALGGVIEGYVLWRKLGGESFQQHIAAIVVGAMLIMVGTQVLLTGLIAVMLARPAPDDAARAEEFAPPAATDAARHQA